VVTGSDATDGIGKSVVRFAACPGKAYLRSLQRDFDNTLPDRQSEFLAALKHQPRIVVDASPALATSLSVVNGTPHIYFANFKGLQPGKNAVPLAQRNVRITVNGSDRGVMHVLPFMGEETQIRGVRVGHTLVFTIPRIDRGAVVWLTDVP
jgi:hypothetical protein